MGSGQSSADTNDPSTKYQVSSNESNNPDNVPVSGFSFFKPSTWGSIKLTRQPQEPEKTVVGGNKRKKGSSSKKNNKNKRKTKKQKSVSN